MGLFRCIIDNSWDNVQAYRRGQPYEFATNPNTDFFTAISDEEANTTVIDLTPLPAWKDLQKDWHVDVPVQFENKVALDGPVTVGDSSLSQVITESAGTGLMTITSPGIEKVSATTFRVYGGIGYITDLTNPISPVTTEVSWPTTVETDLYYDTSSITYVTIDVNGDVVQFDEQPIGDERRDYIQIGVLAHNNLTQIDLASFSPVFSYSTLNGLTDTLDALNLVNMLSDGNVYSAYTGGGNKLMKTAGSILGNAGRNASNSLSSPYVTNSIAEDPLFFFLDVYSDGLGGSTGIPNFGDMDTTVYDDGSGTPATIPDGFYVTRRIYHEPSSGWTFLAMGQTLHKGSVAALASIDVETYDPVPAAQVWLLRGFITYRKGETDFYNNKHVIISSADKFGTGIANPTVGESAITDIPSFKSYPFTSRGVGSGSYYVGGYYQAPDADANLTQASPTVSYGYATASYAAHPFIVASGAGLVDTGQVGIRANFTKITDDGVSTTLFSEVITADITTLTANQYVETSKCLGTVEYELYVVSGTPTTYSLDFNYGLAKYEDFGNRDFMVTDFEVTGFGDANDNNFNVELLRHATTGWTYSAAGFVPGNGAIVELSTDHGVYDEIRNNEYFAYKRAAIDEVIDGELVGGVVVRITQTASGPIQVLATHIGVVF